MFEDIIIMKYGVHAGESVDEIIGRKSNEISETGKMYWGYGGVLCHPLTQVKPFLNLADSKGNDVYLLLTPTTSEHHGMHEAAKYYSHDKDVWNTLPPSIRVYGSKYALVCSDLMKCDLSLDISNYYISVGKSKGKNLTNYFNGRVDKCCASFSNQMSNSIQRVIPISFIAKIEDVVFVK